MNPFSHRKLKVKQIVFVYITMLFVRPEAVDASCGGSPWGKQMSASSA